VARYLVSGILAYQHPMSQLTDALGGVTNIAEPVAGLVSGGQPSAADLAAFKRAGGRSVIDMRDPMEPRPYRAPDAVVAAGLDYFNLPVPHDPGPDGILSETRRLVTELVRLGPVFAHCNSGNRTGAVLIPYLMLDRGMSEDEAVMEAMKMGTRSAALLEWAVAYANRNRAG
jgi:protein tyrosine phosphatase (PTP) superfamily phosphohydrolase (DUF442 family)